MTNDSSSRGAQGDHPVYFISVAPLYPSEGFTIDLFDASGSKNRCLPKSIRVHTRVRRASSKRKGPEKWDTGSCGQRGVHQSVAAIVVGDKNRYIPIDPPGAWSVAVRRLSGL